MTEICTAVCAQLRTIVNGTVVNMHPSDYGLTRAAYSVHEIMEVLSIGRTALYSEINSGRLKRVKRGYKTLFLAPDIASYLDRLPDPTKHAEVGGMEDAGGRPASLPTKPKRMKRHEAKWGVSGIRTAGEAGAL